jgi:hypothetical protein
MATGEAVLNVTALDVLATFAAFTEVTVNEYCVLAVSPLSTTEWLVTRVALDAVWPP